MSSQWIDFRELRSKLRFSDVLQHYHVQLKVKGEQATGFCPLPGHPPHEGKRRSPSFSVNLTRGIFQCFSGGCSRTGGILDFACYMEGVDPSDKVALRKVALQLQERFLGVGNGQRRPAGIQSKAASQKREPPGVESKAQQKPSEGSARPVIVNAPLDFTLKALDAEHPYLKQRGFTSETISHFGLGYCARGLMQGRIVIPLHDPQGRLIGYAGRIVDDNKIDDEHPKYRFPGDREREGVIHQFRKSLLLYSGFQVGSGLSDIIVVEGFASVWHLWQHGFPNVVALMGSSCSHEQAALIAARLTKDGRVWGFTDGDDAGVRCAHSVFGEIGSLRFVRWIKLGEGRQPTDCSPDELSSLLALPHNGREGADGDDANH